MTNDEVLFVADIHGNQSHLDIILDYAALRHPSILIFGGDSAPKSKSKRTPQRQRDFFVSKFFPRVTAFTSAQRASGYECKVFIVFGNDDFKGNYRDVKSLGEKHGVHVLANDLVSIDDRLQLIGYSYVPPTPFKFKDWEKVDIEIDSDKRQFRDEGEISNRKTLTPVNWSQITSRGSMNKT